MIDYIQKIHISLLTNSFLISFFLLLVWEQWLFRVKPTCSLIIRWWNTISLSLINKYLLSFISTITVATYASIHSIGIFNIIGLNSTLAFIFGFLLYDLCNYLLHWFFHVNSVFWRLHRVHHSDPDVDISTELKHHPLESLVIVIFSVIIILSIGIFPVVIILHTLFSQVVSLFSHANIKLSKKVDQFLRYAIITPAMHRIHHSSRKSETDSNYGTLFSFWDRLFNNYTENPKLGYEKMQLGLVSFRSERELWLDKLLLQPFQSE